MLAPQLIHPIGCIFRMMAIKTFHIGVYQKQLARLSIWPMFGSTNFDVLQTCQHARFFRGTSNSLNQSS